MTDSSSRNERRCALFCCPKTCPYYERNNEMREMITDLIRINDAVDELSANMILFPEESPVDPGMTANLVRIKEVIRRLVLPVIPHDGLSAEKTLSAFYRILGSKEDAGEKADKLLQMQKDLMATGGCMLSASSDNQNYS